MYTFVLKSNQVPYRYRTEVADLGPLTVERDHEVNYWNHHTMVQCQLICPPIVLCVGKISKVQHPNKHVDLCVQLNTSRCIQYSNVYMYLYSFIMCIFSRAVCASMQGQALEKASTLGVGTWYMVRGWEGQGSSDLLVFTYY